MPSITSPFFNINYQWALGESGWNSGMDYNLRVISYLLTGTVGSIVSTLPTSPSNGTSLILTTDNNLYVRLEGAWVFITPSVGLSLKNLSDSNYYQFNGTGWVLDSLEQKINSLSSQLNVINGGTF